MVRGKTRDEETNLSESSQVHSFGAGESMMQKQGDMKDTVNKFDPAFILSIRQSRRAMGDLGTPSEVFFVPRGRLKSDGYAIHLELVSTFLHGDTPVLIAP